MSRVSSLEGPPRIVDDLEFRDVHRGQRTQRGGAVHDLGRLRTLGPQRRQRPVPVLADPVIDQVGRPGRATVNGRHALARFRQPFAQGGHVDDSGPGPFVQQQPVMREIRRVDRLARQDGGLVEGISDDPVPSQASSPSQSSWWRRGSARGTRIAHGETTCFPSANAARFGIRPAIMSGLRPSKTTTTTRSALVVMHHSNLLAELVGQPRPAGHVASHR